MGDEADDARSMKEKALFYMTAFFVLLGTFSLFAFLFLVPFVIEPAFTTIFMQFDTAPALCVTVEVEMHKGVSNCSWTSCREGCTKEVYECTQIRVNYKTYAQLQAAERNNGSGGGNSTDLAAAPTTTAAAAAAVASGQRVSLAAQSARFERALREYDYLDGLNGAGGGSANGVGGGPGGSMGGAMSLDEELAAEAERSDLYSDLDGIVQTMGGNDSEWYFSGARLFPNVKGCGYPPMLNCTIWSKLYRTIGTNYTCFYSRVDPSVVISDLDMHKNKLNLIYAMAIPIPSFISSVIYLTFAYFCIYNEDEETVPLGTNAEDMAGEDPQEGGEDVEECEMDVDEVTKGDAEGDEEDEENGGEAGSTGSEQLTTPNSDMPSFGHQLKVQMADEMSRASLDGASMSQSTSFQGNLSKTMTTSISTQGGPIDAV